MKVNDRLREWCKIMILLCFFLATLVPLVAASIWIWPDWFRAFWGVFDGLPYPTSGLSTGQRAAGIALGLASAGVTSFALIHLAAIFREFAEDRAFSERAVRSFRTFALFIFALALAAPFIHAVEGVVLSWNEGQGKRIFALTFRAEELRDILFAFLLTVLALVFQHGHSLADEQAHIL